MAENQANLSGSGPFYIFATLDVIAQGGLTSTFQWTLWIGCSANGWSTWSASQQSWVVNGLASGTFIVDFRPPATSNRRYQIASGQFTWGHNPDGTFPSGGVMTVGFSISTNHSSVGSGSVNVSVGVPRIPQVPPATINGIVDQPTTTSLRYTFSGNGNGGSAIIRWEFQLATDTAFTQNVAGPFTTPGTSIASGLIPATTYYFRGRGVNAVGAGAWGGFASGTTLPAVPPGMTVSPTPNGQGATVAVTPPGGVTGVSNYLVEYRLVPGGTTQTAQNPTSPITVTGLTPGATYEWRASAFIGTYQSPFTDWTPVSQPNPSTNPGDFFDGNTPDTEDVNFAWTGTQNNSTSTVTGVSPLGWAASAVTGSGIIQRVTGGRSGTYGARVTVITDATNVRAGMAATTTYAADVEPGATYFGSLYVSVPSAITVTPEITWLTSAGVVLSRTVGNPVTISTTDTWTRVVVSGAAPAGADFAAVNVLLPTATGGVSLLLDDAMVTLSSLYPWFSGDTLDTDQFRYDWIGDPNASISSRTEIQGDTFDPLADPDCDPVPLPPRPPAVPDPCIVETGTWQRYWYTIPAGEVSEWLSILPTLRITTGCNPDPITSECRPVRQARIRFYPTDLPPSQVETTSWTTEQIISFIPANTVMTLDAVTQRAWASVNGGPQLAADHLLYGTGGVPATWAVLSCGVSYLISVDVPPGLFIDTELFLSQRT